MRAMAGRSRDGGDSAGDARPPPTASIATVPLAPDGMTVPKSRSSTLVRVSGIRMSAFPLALVVAGTGAASAGSGHCSGGDRRRE